MRSILAEPKLFEQKIQPCSCSRCLCLQWNPHPTDPHHGHRSGLPFGRRRRPPIYPRRSPGHHRLHDHRHGLRPIGRPRPRPPPPAQPPPPCACASRAECTFAAAPATHRGAQVKSQPGHAVGDRSRCCSLTAECIIAGLQAPLSAPQARWWPAARDVRTAAATEDARGGESRGLCDSIPRKTVSAARLAALTPRLLHPKGGLVSQPGQRTEFCGWSPMVPLRL